MKEIVGVLKIMRDLYQISSYFSLELYWIGWLLCKTNHSPFSLIFLIIVILVLDCWPLYTSSVVGCPFLISIKFITCQKNNCIFLFLIMISESLRYWCLLLYLSERVHSWEIHHWVLILCTLNILLKVMRRSFDC